MLDIFNWTLRGRFNEIAALLSIKLLLNIKSHSKKGHNLVYLKINLAYFSVVFNHKARTRFTVYTLLEAEELLFLIHLTNN